MNAHIRRAIELRIEAIDDDIGRLNGDISGLEEQVLKLTAGLNGRCGRRDELRTEKVELQKALDGHVGAIASGAIGADAIDNFLHAQMFRGQP